MPAELLHLSLQKAGYPKAHHFINKVIVPRAKASGNDLVGEMQIYLRRSRSQKLKQAWAQVPDEVLYLLQHPDEYLGYAVEMARQEAGHSLTSL